MTLPSITCPQCLRTSTHPKDIDEGYCSACNDWTSPEQTARKGPAWAMCTWVLKQVRTDMQAVNELVQAQFTGGLLETRYRPVQEQIYESICAPTPSDAMRFRIAECTAKLAIVKALLLELSGRGDYVDETTRAWHGGRESALKSTVNQLALAYHAGGREGYDQAWQAA